MRDTLAGSLAPAEGAIRRSLNLGPSESAARPCAATDAVDLQRVADIDPSQNRRGQVA